MPEVPAVPDAGSLSARVTRALDPDGPIAAALDGFETRPSQRVLADRIAHLFEAGGTLVAEAGTGTGKTLAYLLPAVLSGQRVLVSTGTRALQDQVFYKDVPALARALGRSIRAAYMKGRTNYLCRHRFERLQEAAGSLPPDQRAWTARIAEWARVTATGDRAEIDDLPDDLSLWPDMTATSDQCLGRHCAAYDNCFVTRMREQAAAADVVIVNHHLLCADASVRQGDFGEVVPACNLMIVDEAHQLEDVATQYFGVAVTKAGVDELARDTHRAVETASGPALALIACAQAIRAAQDAAHRLFDVARTDPNEGARVGDRAVLTAANAASLRRAATALDNALGGLATALAAVPGQADGLAGARTRTERLRSDLQLVTSAGDPRYVYYVERGRRSVALRAAPIDASAIIRDSVIGRRHAVVLTSATLAVGRSFDYSLSRLGVHEADTLQLPSEFDFRRQAVLYLPPEMPDPRSPEFNAAAADVIERLLACTRGRAFVLFTSYAAMHDVHRRLDGRLEWPLLTQGAAPHSALLREFRATPHAVLLATASFWQGVDVAGEALSCVIVDRLPFASPSDPLVAARLAAIETQGGHPFHDYQVPLAALLLLQGLGRLIRTRSDRGVLAVLDPRLTRMPYGQRFLAALPPAPITDDLDEVRRFLSRDETDDGAVA
ncbi:MAG: ATP-dependent DNA helicase [Acidobacteria bacterium]|nr:ATP-dependent DNA helicase [Acidobacteriota bacterium]